IIAGQREIIERIRRNPLFRALRVDKLTIAALEVTLKAYQRGAFDEIPALCMIRLSQNEVAGRAARVVEGLRQTLPGDVTVESREGFSVVGAGTARWSPGKFCCFRAGAHPPPNFCLRVWSPWGPPAPPPQPSANASASR